MCSAECTGWAGLGWAGLGLLGMTEGMEFGNCSFYYTTLVNYRLMQVLNVRPNEVYTCQHLI